MLLRKKVVCSMVYLLDAFQVRNFLVQLLDFDGEDGHIVEMYAIFRFLNWNIASVKCFGC